jgi:methionine-rich copper-binding protein CopC
MQQATVNLFADMGAQPATLAAGLAAAAASTDATAPAVTVNTPTSGSSVQAGSSITVSGTAADTGGLVGGVEVSTDGVSWHPATGRGSWSYTWTPGAPGAATVRARATDDSANIGPITSVPVTVTARACPCSIWDAAATPALASDPDTKSIELGVKFRSDVAGQVTGIRFYKGSGNTGTHVGHLWTASGTLLGTVTFSGESATGWQQATFASPVTVSPGVTYVASYYAPNGHYAEDDNYFSLAGHDATPLHALADGIDGANGVYRYGTGGGFPTLPYLAANYWVDLVLSTAGSAPDTTPPTVTARTPAAGATGVPTGTAVTATFSEPVQAGTAVVSLAGPAGAVAGATGYNASTQTVTFTPAAALPASATYSVTVSGARDLAGNPMAPVSWTFSTAAASPPPGCPCTIWPATATPETPSDPDTAAVELGVKFRSDVAGQVTGIRFYKGSGNTGTHVGHLWTAAGALLATVTFSGESGSGWQQATFASPVPVSPGTTYVASYYAPVGRYAGDSGFFTAAGVDRAPLHALRDGTDGANGVYRYGTGGGFPVNTWQASNYWVDLTFTS